MKKQAGFGIVGIIIIVVAVTVIGLIAWRVWDAQSSKTTQPAAQSSTSPSQSTGNQPAPTPEPDYFVISELGVKFVLPETIKDFEYSVTDYGNDEKSVRFTTKSLKNQDANCDADFGTIGAISKTKTNAFGPSNEPRAVDNKTLFKFGEYYYAISGPQAACSESKAVNDAVGVARQSLFEAFSTLTSQ